MTNLCILWEGYVDYGSNRIQVRIAIVEDTLNKLIGPNYKEMHFKEKISYFINANTKPKAHLGYFGFSGLQNAAVGIFNRLEKSYTEGKLALQPIKEVTYSIMIHHTYGIRYSDDCSVVELRIPIEKLDGLKEITVREFDSKIAHEFLHIIAVIYENQHMIKNELKKLQSRVEGIIESDTENVKKQTLKILLILSTENLIEDPFSQIFKIEEEIKHLLTTLTDRYWNIVADVALIFIAGEFELGEELEVEGHNEYEEMAKLEEEFKKIKEIKNKIKKKFPAIKDTLIKHIQLLEYCLIFTEFPFRSLTISFLVGNISKKDWWYNTPLHNTSSLNISIFNRVIKMCEKDSRKNFSAFYKEFEKIIKHSNVFAKKVKDIPIQIHNEKSLHSAKKAYRLLLGGYHRLLKEMKESKSQLENLK